MVFPVGRLWARFLPNFKIFGHELNPGPFTIKEHVRTIFPLVSCGLLMLIAGKQVLVTIMAGVGAETAYATEIAAVQRVYYDQIFSFGCARSLLYVLSSPLTDLWCTVQWLLTMSTQLIGFSIGGVTRRFLVSPPSMSTRLLLWPFSSPSDFRQ